MAKDIFDPFDYDEPVDYLETMVPTRLHVGGKPGRPVEGKRKTLRSVNLDQETVDTLLQIGDGNLSAGVRKAAEIARKGLAK